MASVNKDMSAKVLGAVILVLFLPPFISLLWLIFTCLLNRRAGKGDYYAMFVGIALYIGSVNATKMPGGDQWNYYLAYQNVPVIGFLKSLIYIYGSSYLNGEVITNVSGEFMNGVYNFFGYYLTLGYYPLFECLLSMMNLLCVFLGLYHFAQRLDRPHIPIVLGTVTLAFFYQYFNLMLQIQKQFLGQAIMMYVLGYYARYGKMTKRLWIIAAMSVFTHASNALFVPFLVYKPLRSRLSRRTIVAMGILFFALILYAPSMASYVVGGDDEASALTYGMQRMANSEVKNDMEGNMDFMHPRTLITLLPIIYIVCRKFLMRRKRMNETELFVINILLLLTITVFAMFRQPTAQYRYFMMTYMFVPFFIPFLFDKVKWRDMALKGFATLSFVTFFLFFDNIVWIYAPVRDIIALPPVWLIFSNYNGL